jgi:hypothetical protein
MEREEGLWCREAEVTGLEQYARKGVRVSNYVQPSSSATKNCFTMVK